MDWPQWRGPNRDAASAESISTWPPIKLWETNVGQGVSSVVVSSGRAYGVGHRSGKDTVYCFEAATGTRKWTCSYDSLSDHTSDVTLPGPRSTPATDGERLYVLSLEGFLRCFNAVSGELLWMKKPGEMGASIGQYGLCNSPLLHGRLLVCDLHRTCVALDKITGGEVWRAPGGGGWNGAAPMAVHADKTDYLIYGTGRGIRVDTGESLFTVPYNEWSVATPVVVGDQVFLCPFHGRNLGGRECAVIQIKDGKPIEVWKNDEVRALCSTPVYAKGYLYAADRDDISIAGENGRKMSVKCIDFATGRVQWSQRPIPWPTLVVANDKLLIQTLIGELILAPASPEGYYEYGRIKVLEGRCWAVPALANGRLYCRNTKGDLVCLEVGSNRGIQTVPARESPPANETRLTPAVEDIPGFPSIREDTSENWPQFHGPGGQGFSPFTNAPTAWNGKTKQGILWAAPVPLPGFSSPVIWGDRILLSGATRTNREVYCFNTITGKMIWRTAIEHVPKSSANPEQVWKDESYASPTVATDGRYLCALFANGNAACLDFEGRVVWSRNLGALVNIYGHASSPLLWHDLLLLQLDQDEASKGKSRLLALDARSGATVWETKRPVGASWCTPVIVRSGRSEQLVTSGVPWVMSYEPATGAEIWRSKCMENGQWAAPSPIFVNNRIIAVVEGAVLAAVLPDGRGDVSKTHLAWSTEDDLPSVCCPVSNGELLFTLGSGGMLICYDARSGKKLWDKDYSGGGAPFEASPLLVGDRLYFVDETGLTYIVKAARQFEEIGRAELGEVCPGASPAFKDGRIFIRGKSNLYCIGHSG